MFLKGKTMFASLTLSTMAVSHVQTRGFAVADLMTLARLAFVARSQRRHLGRLDSTRLADLGLTAAQAQTEAKRAFWDVPTNWRR
ncbi:DUF1127 domain-containing protein [Cypionkella sp.]|jgi:uncharacterized protein YjiS (DUF1127 family)|uniref:DUF1127 domain-containing protein n=1 Tax=Cypionkella sp. TaxID=2811411 RepID=UPI002FDE2AEE